MAKKSSSSVRAKTAARGKSSTTTAEEAAKTAQAVRDSAQQIWLAGLGAFTRAQAEGERRFNTLVKEGLALTQKTQSAAEERFSEASQKVNALASDIGQRAAGRWDKLETIFEERVAKALDRMGLPSAGELQGLLQRLTKLEGKKPAAPAPKKAAAKTPVAKKAAKPAAKKAAKPAAKAAVKAPAKAAAKAPVAKKAPAKRAVKAVAAPAAVAPAADSAA